MKYFILSDLFGFCHMNSRPLSKLHQHIWYHFILYINRIRGEKISRKEQTSNRTTVGQLERLNKTNKQISICHEIDQKALAQADLIHSWNINHNLPHTSQSIDNLERGVHCQIYSLFSLTYILLTPKTSM